ncbi:glycerophosphodiester phosphodiesterase [Natronosalvus amylolyticus]|uniref:glycerophosphodiester phosphodiesterase n=1 Tax=Natronosalvus amylolyticus TaxID=2961994 RepID=UPI0020CA1908|nr:glycerophosphodiester phosphodiesterase [Natronosalvus amylolyticus]
MRAVSTAATTADAVEVDVRRCGSGELVVIHDSTVDRVTDGNGEVRNLTYDQLAELSVLGTDQRIPLLKEVFETAPESVGIVLDLKERGIASDAVSIGTSFDHKLLVTAFDPAIIEAVNDLPTAVSTGLIVRESRWVNRRLRSWIPGALPWLYGPEDVDSMVANAKQLGCTAILPRYELCLRTSLLESAREADIRVNAWTIAERDTANKLDAVGIDGLIADRAGLL